jgi:hypothetical protein
MSSQRKINSARTNGAKSHGPKTEAGRQKSARNALTHGFYASSIVLQQESPEQYQALLDAYIQQFQPDGPAELQLIEEMVAAKWRQRRLWAIETDLLEDEIIAQKEKLDADGVTYSPITPLTFAYRDLSASAALPSLTRHESGLERSYFRALKTVLELQRGRKPTSAVPSKNIDKRTQSQIRTLPHTPAPSPEAPPSIDLPPCARGPNQQPLTPQDASV